MLKNCRFHHIGIAVHSTKNAGGYYQNAGYSLSSPIEEPVQKVIVVYAKKEGFPTVELLEPLNEQSPIVNILKKSGSGTIYHTCYAVDNIVESVNELKKQRFHPLAKPIPGRRLDNALTVFLYNKDIGLIQLAEIHK